MNKQASITSFQFFAIIIGIIFGNGILSLPRVVAEEAGRGGWVAIAGAGVIATIFALLALLLASMFPSNDPASWGKKLLGQIVGRVWLGIYFARALVVAYLTAKLYAGIVATRVLIFTPTNITSIIVLILGLLAALSQLRGLSRYSEVVFFATIPILLLVYAGFSQGHMFHLQPVLRDTPLSGLASAGLQSAYSFVGFDIVLFVYPYLKEKKKAAATVVSAVLFVTLIYVFTCVASLALFGLERVRTIFQPTAAMLSVSEFIFFERLDSIVIFLWMSTIVITIGSQFYVAARAVQGVLTNASFVRVLASLGGFTVILSVTEIPLRELNKYAELAGKFDLLFFAATLTIFPAVAWFKRRKKQDATA